MLNEFYNELKETFPNDSLNFYKYIDDENFTTMLNISNNTKNITVNLEELIDSYNLDKEKYEYIKSYVIEKLN